jgi:hypothetical protein
MNIPTTYHATLGFSQLSLRPTSVCVFEHVLESLVQLFELPDAIYLVTYVSGMLLERFQINNSCFVRLCASNITAWFNKQFSLNKIFLFETPKKIKFNGTLN